MQKHPRINSSITSGICSFTPQLLPNNMQVSRHAFSRYIHKATFTHSPAKGIKAYRLPCGCYVWCYSSGQRELSALPF
jgi:hypothetical protein